MSDENKSILPEGYSIEPLVEAHVAPEGHDDDCAGEHGESENVFEEGDV